MGHAIPLFPLGDVLDPEIRRQIDYSYARIEQCGRLLHGDTVRRGKKNHIASCKICFRRVFEL